MGEEEPQTYEKINPNTQKIPYFTFKFLQLLTVVINNNAYLLQYKTVYQYLTIHELYANNVCIYLRCNANKNSLCVLYDFPVKLISAPGGVPYAII